MRYWISVAACLMGFTASSHAHADPCKPVEREIVRGTAAAEDAKDKAGFLAAAKEFESAVHKAPACPHGHYNLGLVYEKAGEYGKAVSALKKYLKLAPKAGDASAVQRKIYALEYRAEQQAANAGAARQDKADDELASRLQGRWRPKMVKVEYQNACNFKENHQGTLIELQVTGKQVTGSLIGAAHTDDRRCWTGYKSISNVTFLNATVRDGHLVGDAYDLMVTGYGAPPTFGRKGSARQIDWKISMAADGRSFSLLPLKSGKLPTNVWDYYERY